MRDLKVIQLRALLRVHSVIRIRGFSPPAVMAHGEGMDTASEVFYNDVLADDFVVDSADRLIVKIPKSQTGEALRTFKVFTDKPSSSKAVSISLGLTKPIRTVSGIDRLLQSFMLLLMTNPRSDIFSPASGGGVRALVGKPTDADHKGAATELTLCIERVRGELSKLQTGKNIPPSEKLLSCSLSSVGYDPNTTVLSATVLIQNMLGEQAEVSIR